MNAARLRHGIAVAACLMALSCAADSAPGPEGPGPRADPSGPAFRRVTLAVPGTANRMPSLGVSGNRVAAVWTSTKDEVMDVYAAISEDGGRTFSEPRRVNNLPGDARSNAEQPPRVAMSGSAVTVIWPSRIEEATAIRMSRSSDGGRTFSPAVTIHAASLKGARGWQSITAGQNGTVHAVWLDGRDAEPMPKDRSRPQHSPVGHSGHATGTAHQGAPRQDVYQALILPDGQIVETHVTRDVCFCCKTAVGVGPSGRVNVAWRHIFPESMRDIAMATSVDGGRTFSSLARISEDKWQLSGCPDDGPSMAVDAGDMSHLVWPTLVNQTAPQKAIFYTSTKDGRTFSPRVRLSGDDRDDAGHPQIAVDGAGNVAAVWDEQHGDVRQIVMRTSAAGSGRFGPPRVLNAAGSAFHPFVAGRQQGFLIAWPSAQEGSDPMTIIVMGSDP